MRAIMVLPLLAAMVLLTSCLASLPVKVQAGAGTDGPAKLKELPGGVKLITDADWESEVMLASKDFPVVVDLTAEWCGWCHKLSPILEEISNENRKIKFVKIDTDHNKSDDSFGVQGLPTLLIIKNGSVIDRVVGYKEKAALVSIFSAL